MQVCSIHIQTRNVKRLKTEKYVDKLDTGCAHFRKEEGERGGGRGLPLFHPLMQRKGGNLNVCGYWAVVQGPHDSDIVSVTFSCL